MKMKLNVSGIKQALLEHGEKVVFGGVMLVFLALSWGAISREVLDSSKQPPRLEETARALENHVRNSNWDSSAAHVSLTDYADSVKRDVVPMESYPVPTPINPTIENPKPKRPLPKILKAEQARAASGYGTFSLKEEFGRGRGRDGFGGGQWGGGPGGRGGMEMDQAMREQMRNDPALRE